MAVVNLIWLLLLLVGIGVGVANGQVDAVSNAIFTAAAQGVKITIEITGVLALWMGLLKLAERSGLVNLLASLAAPIVGRLFPQIPRDHPAFGAIIMNLSANLLGLGNAATPFGLKAMEHLQSLNPHPEQASPAMATFLALNTSSFTLVPAMVISLRAQAGSAAPAEIIGATIVATGCGVLCALTLDRIFRWWYSLRAHRGAL